VNRNAWTAFAVAVAGLIAILGGIGWAVWSALATAGRAALVELLAPQAGVLAIGAVILLVMTLIAIRALFAAYVLPLSSVAEEAKLIAVSNPRHRLADAGPRELRDLLGSVNLLADRYQALGEEVAARIREANAALSEEKNTLAALMAKLTQGVLVCNLEGRILLYNQRAQVLLEGPARATGGGDWIGLGRSIYGMFDEQMMRHAISHVRHRLADGQAGGLLVPLMVSRPGGQQLSTHVVPILDAENQLRGVILTFEDVTRRIGADSRRGALVKSLTEGYRSGIAGIRAAIETVLSFPDLDDHGRAAFFEVIRDEALKMSRHLDDLEQEYGDDLNFRWPLDEMLGSDLLAAIERTLADKRGITLEVSAPVEPVWLQVDSYALIQCLTFVVEQLIEWCRAGSMTLTIEQRRSLAAFQLEWDGAVLHMEALRAWGLRNVSTDPHGTSLTLFEVVERHGGAFWTDRGHGGRPCLRLVLPVSDQGGAVDPVGRDDGGHDFDFHLFDGHHGRTGNISGKPLKKLSYTVIDSETTGLDPRGGDEIIALGAVRIVNGRILHREIFDSFVRPARPASAASQAVHGITPDMLRGKPTIEHVLPRFHRFIEDTVLVGHNVAFDMRFLQLQGDACGIRFDDVPTLDTLLLECVLNPNQEDKSLEGIAGRLGIRVTGRHTALGDALTTAEVFLALLPLLEERGIRSFGEAQAACQANRRAEIRY
jgi:DNA polymerase-3 subunit epsilon